MRGRNRFGFRAGFHFDDNRVYQASTKKNHKPKGVIGTFYNQGSDYFSEPLRR
jgi:hypothetical protein